jgi:hypothetical protein
VTERRLKRNFIGTNVSPITHLCDEGDAVVIKGPMVSKERCK